MPHARGNLLKCREPSGSRAPAYATAAVMGAGFVFSMALCWPGHLSYDSVVQLLEGRTATYTGWHPPVMSWLLGLSDWALTGAGLFVLANALVFFGSLFSLILLRSNVSWAAPLAAGFVALTPQLALYQGTVWKDILFANAAVAGLVAQAHFANNWQNPFRRYALIALSFLFLTLASLTRQNGMVLLFAGSVSLFSISARRTKSRRRAAVHSAAVLAVSLLATLAATAALNTRLVPDAGLSRQLKRLELYDLVGALYLDPTLRFPELQRSDPALVRLMRSDGGNFYTPVRSDALAQSAPLQSALERVPDASLHHAWIDLILHHPADYLRARTAAFHWVLLTPRISLCVPYVVGLRGPPQTMEALGLKTRFNLRDQWADEYGTFFLPTPMFSHLTFLLLAFAELAFLLYRRRTADPAFIALLGGIMAFAASFFFISLACDYRYIYPLDLAALTALFYIALDPRLARPSRGGAAISSAPPLPGETRPTDLPV